MSHGCLIVFKDNKKYSGILKIHNSLHVCFELYTFDNKNLNY